MQTKHTHTHTVGEKLEYMVSGIWPKLHLMIDGDCVLGHETTCRHKNLAAACGNNTIQWGFGAHAPIGASYTN